MKGNKQMKCYKILLSATLCALSTNANAALLTYNFSGTISQLDINVFSGVPFNSSSTIGATYTGTYTFDTDLYSQRNISYYDYTGDNAKIEVNIEGINLFVSKNISTNTDIPDNQHTAFGSNIYTDASLAFPELTNSPPVEDRYIRGMAIRLDQATNDYMPLGENGFQSGSFIFKASSESDECIAYDYYDPSLCVDINTTGHDIYTIQGTIESFSLASPVPLPPAIWLFGSGLLGLIGLTKLKIKNT